MATLFTRAIQPMNFFHFSAIVCGSVFLCVANTSAIPLDDVYDRGQAEVRVSPEFNSQNGMPPVFNPCVTLSHYSNGCQAARSDLPDSPSS